MKELVLFGLLFLGPAPFREANAAGGGGDIVNNGGGLAESNLAYALGHLPRYLERAATHALFADAELQRDLGAIRAVAEAEARRLDRVRIVDDRALFAGAEFLLPTEASGFTRVNLHALYPNDATGATRPLNVPQALGFAVRLWSAKAGLASTRGRDLSDRIVRYASYRSETSAFDYLGNCSGLVSLLSDPATRESLGFLVTNDKQVVDLLPQFRAALRCPNGRPAESLALAQLRTTMIPSSHYQVRSSQRCEGSWRAAEDVFFALRCKTDRTLDLEQLEIRRSAR